MPSAKPPSVDVSKEVAAAIKVLQPALAKLKRALALNPNAIAVGALADYLYDLRQAKAALSTITTGFDDVLPPAIKLVEDYFVNSLKVGEASGVQGMKSRVQVTDTPIPQVKAEDWLKFFTYVAKTKQWELLNHALNRAAVKERWERKRQVKFVTAVSCTKLGGKKGRK